MVTRIIYLMLFTSYLLSAGTLCTSDNMSNNPQIASTCKMYEATKLQNINYVGVDNSVDYTTENTHKISLQKTFYPSPISIDTFKEHFSFFKKITDVTMIDTAPNASPSEDKYLKIFSRPINGQEGILYCDSGFDLFTTLTFTDRMGQKQDIVTFLNREKDIYQQLKKMSNGMNIGVESEQPSVVGINKNFNIYCGKLKTNTEGTFGWNSSECSQVRGYLENGNGSDTKIKNELASGNIYVDNVYIGEDSVPQKVCKINYKKELRYDSSCSLQQSDIFLNQGETTESKLRQIKDKYTAAICCAKHPNSYIHIQNPFSVLVNSTPTVLGMNDLIKENFGKLNLSSSIKCVANTISSGYKTIIPIEKNGILTLDKTFDVGCGGITYTGVYEQNMIDRLNNYKHVLNELAAPYTKCCSEDSMSNIQKFGYGYAIMQCAPDMASMMTLGTYKGVKVTDSLSDAYSSCSRHLADTDIKGGTMGNSGLVNGGVRVKQGLSGTTNFLGCMGEEISDMETIKLIKGCIDSNYQDFMSFIEWLVSQQITLNIGIERFKGEVCRSEIERQSNLDLSFNLGSFFGDDEKSTPVTPNDPLVTAEVTETLRLEEGKNYYGVIKRGNQYIPALTLQDEAAFVNTNSSRPFAGLNSKEEPTYLLSEISELLGLSYDIPNVNGFERGMLSCKNAAFENMKKIISGKLGPIKELKTIDGYIHLYANNGKLLNTGKIKDIGFFLDSGCSLNEKEDILKFFNVALKNYIVAFLQNKPKTLKEAELGLIKQVLTGPEEYVYKENPMTATHDIQPEADTGTNGSSLFYDGLAKIESHGSGGYTAYNKGSGAYGKYQFIPKTEKEFRNKLNLTQSQCRTPSGQEAMIRRFTGENANYLRSQGVPVTDETLWWAHNQGMGGAVKLYKGIPISTKNIASNIPKTLAPTNANYIAHWAPRWNGVYKPSQFSTTPIAEIGYNSEEYERVLQKYVKEEADKENPIYLQKKSLEIYQNMKRNKEIVYFKNIDLLKKSIGAF